MGETEVAEIWDDTLSALERRPDVTTRQLGFVRLAKPMGILTDHGTFFIAVPHEQARTYLENSMRGQLISAMSEVIGRDVRFGITVDPSIASDGITGPSPMLSPSEPEQYDYDDEVPAPTPPPAPVAVELTRLNPKYVFDTFVIGASNRFAHATAVAVAEAPAQSYNPLFIYGGSGLGKTHLLHAIGHYAHNLNPGVRVRYVNSEEFTNDFINTIAESRIGHNKTSAFQRRYRDVDVLLIDDIQFLQGKEETMEAFFHTFNALQINGKQIVITSDVPPKLLEGFEERLRNRFEWGLVADVQPPDLETRIAILRKKAAYEELAVPDDVLSYIASRVSTNIRELEGSLIRVTAFANLNKQPVDLTLAENVLRDLITDDQPSEITPSLIIAQTAAYFGLTMEEICSTSRSRALTNARQIAMYLCRELTDLPLIEIGKNFGGRDHTTVMHANKKITGLMNERRSVYNQVTELTSRIKNPELTAKQKGNAWV